MTGEAAGCNCSVQWVLVSPKRSDKSHQISSRRSEKRSQLYFVVNLLCPTLLLFIREMCRCDILDRWGYHVLKVSPRGKAYLHFLSAVRWQLKGGKGWITQGRQTDICLRKLLVNRRLMQGDLAVHLREYRCENLMHFSKQGNHLFDLNKGKFAYCNVLLTS